MIPNIHHSRHYNRWLERVVGQFEFIRYSKQSGGESLLGFSGNQTKNHHHHRLCRMQWWHILENSVSLVFLCNCNFIYSGVWCSKTSHLCDFSPLYFFTVLLCENCPNQSRGCDALCTRLWNHEKLERADKRNKFDKSRQIGFNALISMKTNWHSGGLIRQGGNVVFNLLKIVGHMVCTNIPLLL